MSKLVIPGEIWVAWEEYPYSAPELLVIVPEDTASSQVEPASRFGKIRTGSLNEFLNARIAYSAGSIYAQLQGDD